jgi:hypothetical protein
MGHGNIELSILDFDPGNYQSKITILGQIVRQPDLWLVNARLDGFNQPKKAVKRSIYYLQSLLSNISVEKLIVFVLFAQMVNRLIAQVLAFHKKVLANVKKTYIVDIFTQPTQLSQSQEFGFAEVPQLVFLSRVHGNTFAHASV